MKVRNKGKGKGRVHPSLSSSSVQSPADDIFSVLNLLPAAILLLVSLLSLQDREVLAYMITRLLESDNPSFQVNAKNKNIDKKKPSPEAEHAPALDCDCFKCYTSYWYKWDSSPNREAIHQAIEAFEEHLNNDEQFRKGNRNKKKDKTSRRRFTGKEIALPEISTAEKEPADVIETENHYAQALTEKLPEEVPAPEPEPVVRSGGEIEHKGLARKVLPDIMGLLNSRLWNLWSPNV